MYYFRQPLVQPVFIHTIFDLYLKTDFINTVQRPNLFNERRDTFIDSFNMVCLVGQTKYVLLHPMTS